MDNSRKEQFGLPSEIWKLISEINSLFPLNSWKQIDRKEGAPDLTTDQIKAILAKCIDLLSLLREQSPEVSLKDIIEVAIKKGAPSTDRQLKDRHRKNKDLPDYQMYHRLCDLGFLYSDSPEDITMADVRQRFDRSDSPGDGPNPSILKDRDEYISKISDHLVNAFKLILNEPKALSSLLGDIEAITATVGAGAHEAFLIAYLYGRDGRHYTREDSLEFLSRLPISVNLYGDRDERIKMVDKLIKTFQEHRKKAGFKAPSRNTRENKIDELRDLPERLTALQRTASDDKATGRGKRLQYQQKFGGSVPDENTQAEFIEKLYKALDIAHFINIVEFEEVFQDTYNELHARRTSGNYTEERADDSMD